jgi:PPM family protein phosphatase
MPTRKTPASCLVADDEEMDFDVHRAEAPFLPGDRLLLCSDGVHDTLGDDSLIKLADSNLTLLQQVEVWRKAVLRAGAPDNFSMLLAQR